MTVSRTRELEILNGVAEALNRSPDVASALTRTLELLAKDLGFATSWVWLRDPQTAQFYLAAAHNLPPFLQEPVRMAGASVCWCIEAFLDGDFASMNIDAMECSRLRPAVLKHQTALTRGLASHASVALRFGERELGILNLTARGFKKASAGTLRLLTTIAYQIGIAIERARLAETAADIARIQERANLARDLHDTFTQDLTALGLQLEAALHGVDDRSEAGKRIVHALDLARDGVKKARESVERLREGPFAGATFSGAIHETTRTFTSQTGIPVSLDVHPVELETNAETQLYAILTEALTNVRKHAHARHVQITLARRAGSIQLTISDDGNGMKNRTPAGFGIRGMRERAEFMGARLTISRVQPTGTAVTVRISKQ